MKVGKKTVLRDLTHMINMMEKHSIMTISCDGLLLGIIKEARDIIREQPEIVRCKDCKYKQKSYVADRQWWCNRLEKHCDDDWFCADGEKKDG